jgi:hypothetical protein
MTTVEKTTSTWGADIVRGLAHPDSVAARQARIRIANSERQLRAEKFSRACSLIHESLRTTEQLADLLETISATLNERNNGDTMTTQDIELIDCLADVVKYRTAYEIENLADAVEKITEVDQS